jgi:hypothetical protein
MKDPLNGVFLPQFGARSDEVVSPMKKVRKAFGGDAESFRPCHLHSIKVFGCFWDPEKVRA